MSETISTDGVDDTYRTGPFPYAEARRIASQIRRKGLNAWTIPAQPREYGSHRVPEYVCERYPHIG